ncbi:MAG: TIGR03118 family protein [Acidobacteriia bacterium]|nr:TIGR03118 family protein [Terriglobia bacterium]
MCDSGAPKPCSDKALVQFIEHTVAGTRPGTPGGATFKLDWTPPAADSGDIVLYAAANAANGNGNELGDHIYNTSVEITAAVPSTTPPSPSAIPISKYAVQNLVSDIPGFATQTDPNLTNPWGIALNPTGPFWISNNRSGTSTLYNGLGQPFPVASALVVRIPTGSPTAQVFNGTPACEIASGNPALFIFATESGTISGWNPAVDAGNAKVMVDRSPSGSVLLTLRIFSFRDHVRDDHAATFVS